MDIKAEWTNFPTNGLDTKGLDTKEFKFWNLVMATQLCPCNTELSIENRKWVNMTHNLN